MPDASKAWVKIGNELRAVRKLRQQTQAQFAHNIGISPRLVSDLETGARTNYDAGTRSIIENVLGWDYGSVERVIEGGRPKRTDPEFAQLQAIWRTLPPEAREFLLTAAKFMGSYTQHLWGDHR